MECIIKGRWTWDPSTSRGFKEFTLGNIHRKFQIYVFADPTWSYVFYDGTISGGLIPFEDSPHTLSNDELEQWLLVIDTGLVIQYKTVGLRYRRTVRSDRFDLDDIFSFGQFDLVFMF